MASNKKGTAKVNKEYVVFVENLDDLEDGQENEIVVKSLSPGIYKYSAHYVRALVSSSTDKLPGADTLWIRFAMGVLHPAPWAIHIMQELGDYRHPEGK